MDVVKSNDLVMRCNGEKLMYDADSSEAKKTKVRPHYFLFDT